MPHCRLRRPWSIPIGLIIASAFSAIPFAAQELVPNRVGMISGLFYGLAFGMGGLGAGAAGTRSPTTPASSSSTRCAFLPALGLFTALLPDINRPDTSRHSPAPAREFPLGIGSTSSPPDRCGAITDGPPDLEMARRILRWPAGSEIARQILTVSEWRPISSLVGAGRDRPGRGSEDHHLTARARTPVHTLGNAWPAPRHTPTCRGITPKLARHPDN